MEQLPLGFGVTPRYRAEDFIVSDSNREAYEWVMRWPDWPSHALCIYGPPACGKTHLAHIWQARSNARPLHYGQLAYFSPFRLPLGARHYVLEDEGEGLEEHDFLHFFNYQKENGGSLLLTAPHPPSRYDVTLPDLRSRLRGMPAVAVREPDDDLLAAVLIKHVSDRQLKLDKDVLDYLLPRIPRSFQGVADTVARLDAVALKERRNLTVPFVRNVLRP